MWKEVGLVVVLTMEHSGQVWGLASCTHCIVATHDAPASDTGAHWRQWKEQRWNNSMQPSPTAQHYSPRNELMSQRVSVSVGKDPQAFKGRFASLPTLRRLHYELCLEFIQLCNHHILVHVFWLIESVFDAFLSICVHAWLISLWNYIHVFRSMIIFLNI